MAVQPTSIRFLGNGRETQPYKNPHINREPMRKGIVRSTPKTVGEFQKLSLQENSLKNPQSLGQAAVRLMRVGGGVDLLA